VKQYYVYILCSDRNGTLYIGVTSDLKKRIYQHKNKLAEGFTREFGVDKLVWYEVHAITREKQLKAWKRDWKKKLIEE